MARKKDLHELFHEALKDIYFAKKKILSTLPKMAKAAQSEELKAAFEKHEEETEEHETGLELRVSLEVQFTLLRQVRWRRLYPPSWLMKIQPLVTAPAAAGTPVRPRAAEPLE